MNLRNAVRSEDTEQITVINWAEWNRQRYPELKWLHHCPNGGSRNRMEAVKFKQMGVKAGVSDLCLPYPKGVYCGLYIEMKYGKNGQQDQDQAHIQAQGQRSCQTRKQIYGNHKYNDNGKSDQTCL